MINVSNRDDKQMPISLIINENELKFTKKAAIELKKKLDAILGEYT